MSNHLWRNGSFFVFKTENGIRHCNQSQNKEYNIVERHYKTEKSNHILRVPKKPEETFKANSYYIHKNCIEKYINPKLPCPANCAAQP